jgi:hypothetical protein
LFSLPDQLALAAAQLLHGGFSAQAVSWHPAKTPNLAFPQPGKCSDRHYRAAWFWQPFEHPKNFIESVGVRYKTSALQHYWDAVFPPRIQGRVLRQSCWGLAIAVIEKSSAMKLNQSDEAHSTQKRLIISENSNKLGTRTSALYHKLKEDVAFRRKWAE